MDRTREYIMGIITGLAIAMAFYSCTSPLVADVFEIGTEFNPMYVKIVE